ncbi:MAG TPA: HAMP domain-containing sensor histidine kinase [Gaiellaceae bacterium]|nr:HAMP domain-containing sensor histidine kinase [Gaiellaceae bacterium]
MSTSEDLHATAEAPPWQSFHRFPYGVIGLGADRRVQFGNGRAAQLLGSSAFDVGEALPLGFLSGFVDLVFESPDDMHTTALTLPGGRVIRVSGLGPQGDEPALLILEDATAQERQDRILREFVRNAAHQLRTPLTAIASAVEVLQAGAKEVPAERDRFLGHVEVQSNRLIQIARGLLVLARAQSGEAMLTEPIKVRPLLEKLAGQAEPRSGVVISVDCGPDLAARGVRDLLQEALVALVENAVEHTSEGEILLTADGKDARVGISVADSGAGVLPEHRARIFEPFYRPTADGRGFGLGLAIASEAVRAMGGALFVDDSDVGAKFTICLPAAEGAD